MREGAPGAKAHSVPVQPAAAAGATQLQGLDAMVADLLRPMLRRWLDENMPRLVSAALKAEAENPPRRDPKKS
jgi:cell pole-organizing protein PopZ